MKTCFVSMPFGKKTRSDGRTQDFDAVWDNAIKLALAELGYEARRGDELGGHAVILKAQLAAVMNSGLMIADVTRGIRIYCTN